jgi:squalene synthase HpnC
MYSTAGDVSDVVLKARRENFPVASRLLPRRYRCHLLAVYGFARFVDDIGDDAGDETKPVTGPGDRLGLLDAVEADLVRLYDGRDPHLTVIRALEPTVAACALPAAPLHRLIEANRRDQSVTRYPTFEDLLGYCELSANPVGHIVLHVFGAATPARLALSDQVCSALQIIEHCQDVGEDYRRGRVYLPADDLRRYGCAEDDLAEAPAPARLRRVVALEAGRARRLLEAGDPLTASLGGFARLAVAGYVAGGRATAAALRRADHEVLGRAVRPRTARLLTEWLRVLVAGREAVR